MRMYEKVTRYKSGRFKIRVWREITNTYTDSHRDHDILTLLEDTGLTLSELAQSISGLPKVNAVEVKEKGNPNAILIYPEWP